ncbi:hypothetical protein SAY86_024499 [Trapa natans]|uniref:Translation initiation factor eIF2B subunit delta n=1 Tax=Trapa natans TaxID=22666 RepID=A0AAN7M5B3_TRANT|nr:hypothetical protein SAY86_024499 [Trapa natans]
MEPRRNLRTVIDPKVRKVGFFAPPDRSQSGPADPISAASAVQASSSSPSGNTLSPVMIPPPRHHSDSLVHPQPSSRPVLHSAIPSSYTAASEFSPTAASSYTSGSRFPVDVEDGPFSPSRLAKGTSVKVLASSVPNVSLVTKPSNMAASDRSGRMKMNEMVAPGVEVQNELHGNTKLSKDKLSKAERRALQESQRAAKAAARVEASKGSAGTFGTAPAKAAKAASRKSDNASVAASEKKVGDRPVEKERKKDVPQPRMQYDDTSRVEKAKRRAVVKQTEARNRVELFRHLPQYEHGSQLPDLVAKFFQLEPMHPAVYKIGSIIFSVIIIHMVGLHYLSGDISGGNARCIAMLQAFQEVIKDYSTPPEKTLSRDLTAKISSYVSFFTECRPLSVSMGNAIRFLKSRIAKLPLTMSESEAKTILQSDIDHFINEKIVVADKVIVSHAVTKIRDGDVLLTYVTSSAVEMILQHAYELGKQFRVVVVDSRPKLEGQFLLRRLVAKGISCTYIHINAVSYIMHEVTRVFLGASAVLSNGTIYSRVGTACVAMVAHAFQVPVLVCCEAYKFHERVQLDSICSNELGM